MPAIPRPDPPLGDEEIALGAFESADEDSLVVICNDPAIARFTFVPAPYAAEHALDFIANQERRRLSGEALDLAIRGRGALVGATGLRVFDYERGSCEIGYWTAPAARGEGIAPRAISLYSAWALRTLEIQRVELHVDEQNDASRRVAEKAGFELTPRRAAPEAKGRRWRMLVYELYA